LRRKPITKKIKKILLIRLRKLGDTILATLVADALKKHFPEAEIHYLVEEQYSELFFNHPSIDRVIRIKKGLSPGETLRFGIWLKKEDFSLAIDLHSGPRSAILSFLSSNKRFGFKNSYSFLYTRTIPRRLSMKSHHAENQFQILTLLGINAKPGSYRFPPPEALKYEIEEEYALIHPFASPLKSLSAEQAYFLAKEIEKIGLMPVFTGSSEEKEKINALGIGKNLAGISLTQMRALAAGAKVFIGIDSGPAHLASTTQVPIVVIFGPHLSEWYRPWRKNKIAIIEKDLPCRPCSEKKCILKKNLCILSITPEEIMERVKSLIGY